MMLWNPWAKCKQLQQERNDLDLECDRWFTAWDRFRTALEEIAKAQRPGDAAHIAKKVLIEDHDEAIEHAEEENWI